MVIENLASQARKRWCESGKTRNGNENVKSEVGGERKKKRMKKKEGRNKNREGRKKRKISENCCRL